MFINWTQYPEYTSLSTGDKIIVSAPDGNTKKVPASAIATTDTLQTVTNNGNTTTNSITIGSSDTPTKKLNINQTADSEGLRITGYDNENNSYLDLYVDNFGSNYITSSEFLAIHSGGSTRIRSTGYLRLEAGGTSNQLQVDVNHMKFTSGASERMRLTTTGLGIGTTNPLGNLQIGVGGGGTAALFSGFIGVSHGSLKMFAYGNTTPTIQLSANDSGTGGGTTYFNSGNFGIGTASPDAILHIKDVNPRIIKLEDANYSNQYATIGFDDGHLKFSADPAGQRANSVILFNIDNSEKARITSGGNLLLGTTTNGDRLTVSGNIVSYHIGHTTDAFRVTHNSNDVFLSLYKRSDQSNPDVRLRTNGDSYINGGNLGLGITSPALQSGGTGLHINASAHSEIKFTNSTTGTASTDGTALVSSGTGFTINNREAGSLTLKTNNTTRATIDSATINFHQIVLIGTTTNSGVYKLDVAGKARVQNAFELEDVLTLKQISTPPNPASGKSSIYMDSADGAIKVKINVGGTVVTRTLASFE